MPSLSRKDRVSLCSFTFSDGRRCLSPRAVKNPHFCFYHVQKEAQARAAEKLGKDLAYFFSGDYLSACDLSTALSRLIPAVVRGDVKPRTARTVPYLAQTLMQAIHIGQHEYINAFGTDGWRKSIHNSVNSNHDYLFPPKPEPKQPQPQAQQPGPSSRAPMPPTSSEFVQHVVAGLQTGQKSSPPAPQPSTTPPQAQPLASQPAETPTNCHSERSEESAFSESPAGPSQIIPAPQQPPLPIPKQTPSCSGPRPISNFISRSAEQPTADRPIHSATHRKQGRLRAPLRPQLPPPHRRETLLESTLRLC